MRRPPPALRRPSHRRPARRLSAAARTVLVPLAGLLGLTSVLAGSGVAPAGAHHDQSIRGLPAASAIQMAAWYETSGHTADLPITVRELAEIFLEEGFDEHVRGDIAFVQAIVETGWFQFSSRMPSHHNNYSGLGAVDGGSGSASFPSPRIGVRAQIQHLRAYADSTVTADGFAHDLVDPRFDDLQGRYGSVTTWAGMGNGNWASDPSYGSKILSLYADLMATGAGVPDSCDGAAPGSFLDGGSGPVAGAVDCVAHLGIAHGVTDDYYAPSAPVTRAQMATFLVRTAAAMGQPLDAGAAKADPFLDDDGLVHEPHIATVAGAGIAGGLEPGIYGPLRPVTRAQMATFLVRAARTAGLDVPWTGWSGFSDTTGDVHRDNIEVATRLGLASGHSDGTFRPTEPVTRGQMALFLTRLLVLAEA